MNAWSYMPTCHLMDRVHTGSLASNLTHFTRFQAGFRVTFLNSVSSPAGTISCVTFSVDSQKQAAYFWRLHPLSGFPASFQREIWETAPVGFSVLKSQWQFHFQRQSPSTRSHQQLQQRTGGQHRSTASIWRVQLCWNVWSNVNWTQVGEDLNFVQWF